MDTTQLAVRIAEEIEQTVSRIAPAQGAELCAMLCRTPEIFAAGMGRSGFSVRAFAMRLMHMGFAAHVAGETVTPRIGENDLLVIASASGETQGLLGMAAAAREARAHIALVTARPRSSLAAKADAVVHIPAPTPKAASDGRSMQPMGSLFEQSCLVFFDAVIMRLMEERHEDVSAMFARHANLE